MFALVPVGLPGQEFSCAVLVHVAEEPECSQVVAQLLHGAGRQEVRGEAARGVPHPPSHRQQQQPCVADEGCAVCQKYRTWAARHY